MNNFKIEIEVSLRDCKNFNDYMKDSDITNIFEFEVEQTSSNSWILTSEENLNEFTKEEIINEVYEFCEGYEVEIITEY